MKRLTAQDWIDFALTMLAREGAQALKADVLARGLGVSRGSFYWHFPGLDAFHAHVIEHWKKINTEAVIADIERHQAPAQRLDALLSQAFGRSAGLEIRMRAWAGDNVAAARAVDDIDRRRREYIARLLVTAGVAPALAATRAQLLYWSYLGAASSRTRLSPERLEAMIAELGRLALGDGRGASAGSGRRPRRPRA